MENNENIKEIICICCPKGCHLNVNIKANKVTGNNCERGAKYGLEEVTNPTRIITTTVKVKNGELAVLPVKTNGAIPKKLNLKCIEIIKQIKLEAPINIGDIIYNNILETGIDIVACRNIKIKKESN